jgi:hypothetical protein
MSWISLTWISSLMRGPSLAAGCAVLIGRRMVLFSYVITTSRQHPFADHDDIRPQSESGNRGTSELFRCKSTTMLRLDLLRAGAICGET